ncbi:ribonuclease P protein subunit p40 isoform X2 [Monomorium pharaonis]|uniref:ribonuclease P protein subunit p40 isoform X2 n=1 Tax=Monomorium pharaonis TaxID=307658 RepID=UPI00063ED448|nr:ribonuclease P protein subunit p40 isoform X2 [Monomorium pharaonis]
MLCPETWNFQPPPHHIFVNIVDFRKTNIPAVVKNHYFNHSISIVLPDTVTIPQSLHNCLSKDTDYYRINNLCISDLLNIEFIEAFVKKDDYHALGLEGKPSAFSHKPHTRYMVDIDLTSETFVPGKKNYDRVRIALEERLTQKFDVIISWDSSNINICPSSVAAWFHARNYNVYLCRQKFSQRTKYSLAIPVYEDKHNNKCKTDSDFFEWLGVFNIDGDLSIKEEDYANTYRCPSPSIQVGQVQYLQWSGFFTRRKIQKAYDALKQYALSRNTLPWISLDVQGFADSPISFNLKEHMFFTDGDNSYTIIFRSKGEAVVRTSLSSNNNKIKNN